MSLQIPNCVARGLTLSYRWILSRVEHWCPKSPTVQGHLYPMTVHMTVYTRPYTMSGGSK